MAAVKLAKKTDLTALDTRVGDLELGSGTYFRRSEAREVHVPISDLLTTQLRRLVLRPVRPTEVVHFGITANTSLDVDQQIGDWLFSLRRTSMGLHDEWYDRFVDETLQPVADWRLDDLRPPPEGTNTDLTLTDHAGSADGEWVGPPTLEDHGPPVGERLAATFHGRDDDPDLVTYPEQYGMIENVDLSWAAPFTVLWWMKPTEVYDILTGPGPTGRERQYILGARLADDSQASSAPGIMLYCPGDIQPAIRVRTRTSGGSTEWRCFTKDQPGPFYNDWNLCSWSHRSDVSIEEGFADIFRMNGWNRTTEPELIAYEDAPTNFLIGRATLPSGSPDYPFSGSLARMLIVPREVTIDEHRHMYGFVGGWAGIRASDGGDANMRPGEISTPFEALTEHKYLSPGDGLWFEALQNTRTTEPPPPPMHKLGLILSIRESPS